jgi:TLC domain-containing protein
MQGLIPPILSLQTRLQPFADAIGLQALPLHIHEIAFAFVLYHVIFQSISPSLSTWLLPHYYRQFDRKVALKWNLQWVSMVQSLLICTMALWVISHDPDRSEMSPESRVWGFSAAAGSVQAFATGYFLWDIVTTLQNLDDLGVPVLIHAVSCAAVYLLGFVCSLVTLYLYILANTHLQRPIFSYYSCVFVLFELSTPFLNIHLFLNQLGKSGSLMQLCNGLVLIIVFFSARVVYGFYSSFQWYKDVGIALEHTRSGSDKLFVLVNGSLSQLSDGREPLPWWLIAVFVVSNITLNTLNVVWFGKMISTLRKRQQGIHTKRE